ncbi:MAG TPA: hypothetical protein VD835_15015 [Pyrinomonadaceae bacterium]|nr:hypothetical protein [Pyrinomonadaceae bacterium]
MRMRKQRNPPYTQKLFMKMPDGAERAVKLPSVEGVEIGARNFNRLHLQGAEHHPPARQS